MRVIEVIVDLFYDDKQSFWLTIAALAVTLLLARVGSPWLAAIFLPLGLAATLVLYQRRMMRGK